MSYFPPFQPPMPTGPASQMFNGMQIPRHLAPSMTGPASAFPRAGGSAATMLQQMFPPGGAPGAGGAASGAGAAGGGGMLSRAGAGLRGAGTALRGAGVRGIGGAALTRGAPWMFAGQLAGNVIPENDGTTDDAIEEALKFGGAGAGIGATVGSIVPGIGTTIGAGVGGGLGLVGGAVKGLLSGGDSPATQATKEVWETSDMLNELTMDMGLSGETAQSVLDQFRMKVSMLDATGALSKDTVEAEAAQIISQLPMIMEQDRMMQEYEQAAALDERQRASAAQAAQEWLGPMLQDMLGDSDQYAQDLSRALTLEAQQISDPAFRQAQMARAAQVPLDTATQNAYMLQSLMLAPNLYGYNTQGTDPATGMPPTDMMSIMNATPMQPQMGMQPGMMQQMGMQGVQPGQQMAPTQTGALPPNLMAPEGTPGDELLAQILANGSLPTG